MSHIMEMSMPENQRIWDRAWNDEFGSDGGRTMKDYPVTIQGIDLTEARCRICEQPLLPPVMHGGEWVKFTQRFIGERVEFWHNACEEGAR